MSITERRAVRICRAARAFCFTILARLKHVKTNVVEKSQWGRELEVEIEAERIEKELNRAYRTYQKRVEIPGFRKGKVPLRLIVSRYGASIRSEVISDMLPTFLEDFDEEDAFYDHDEDRAAERILPTGHLLTSRPLDLDEPPEMGHATGDGASHTTSPNTDD